MSTRQPNWVFRANLGDVHALEHGGYFVYVDETGVYAPEAELSIPPCDEIDLDAPEARWTVFRFSLDKLKLVDGHLVPDRYQSDWPHPVADYREWFQKDLKQTAECVGMGEDELAEMFCSDDVCKRAQAYRTVGDVWGFENLDSYPLSLTRAEMQERLAVAV
jgi:hypothetical protein